MASAGKEGLMLINYRRTWVIWRRVLLWSYRGLRDNGLSTIGKWPVKKALAVVCKRGVKSYRACIFARICHATLPRVQTNEESDGVWNRASESPLRISSRVLVPLPSLLVSFTFFSRKRGREKCSVEYRTWDMYLHMYTHWVFFDSRLLFARRCSSWKIEESFPPAKTSRRL